MKTFVWTDEVPEQSGGYLTPGKRYPLRRIDGDGGGWIIADNGRQSLLCLSGCAHLDGRAWNVETVADPEPEPSELERLLAGIRSEINWHEAEVEAFHAYLRNADYVEESEMEDLKTEIGWHTTAATRLRALLPQPTPEPEGK